MFFNKTVWGKEILTIYDHLHNCMQTLTRFSKMSSVSEKKWLKYTSNVFSYLKKKAHIEIY